MNYLALLCGVIQVGAAVLEVAKGRWWNATLWLSVGVANLVTGAGKLSQ